MPGQCQSQSWISSFAETLRNALLVFAFLAIKPFGASPLTSLGPLLLLLDLSLLASFLMVDSPGLAWTMLFRLMISAPLRVLILSLCCSFQHLDAISLAVAL